MVMRVGGLATGMDLEAIVNKLMDAERMPLTRMQQERTTLEWQRDRFREINKALVELDDLAFDMKMSKNYKTKKVSSTKDSAVTASGSTSAMNGTYSINVESLATSAINVSTKEIDFGQEDTFDPNKTLKEQGMNQTYFGTFSFYTYDEEKMKMEERKFTVDETDTLNSVLKKINEADKNVRAFYDSQTNKVIIETTRTGKYNNTSPESEHHFNGAEIGFSDETNLFFIDVLNLSPAKNDTGNPDAGGEQGGKDAVFTYNNGLRNNSQNNWYELNGVTFEFHNVTNENVQITVNDDIDHAYNAINNFVKKYNEVIELINGTQTEERYRDFKPLTEEQKKEMSEDQIKKWEEKAKSGILRGEASLTSGMYGMRQSWYSKVDTDGVYSFITQIGIKTTSKYMDGGTLEIKEDDLKKALRENPDDVQKLFNGVMDNLRESVKSTMNRIEERAGKGTAALDNYMLGKRLKELNDRISAFEARMIRVENRYWNQFTAMEKAIQRMNDQSAQLFSQFGG